MRSRCPEGEPGDGEHEQEARAGEDAHARVAHPDPTAAPPGRSLKHSPRRVDGLSRARIARHPRPDAPPARALPPRDRGAPATAEITRRAPRPGREEIGEIRRLYTTDGDHDHGVARDRDDLAKPLEAARVVGGLLRTGAEDGPVGEVVHVLA